MNPLLVEKILYKDVDGYGVAAQARDENGAHGENFTYGEVTPQVVDQMLTATGASEGEVFYDLGCGTGKGVLYAAALTPVTKSVGVELLPGLYCSACGAKDRFHRKVQPFLDDNGKRTEVEFLNEDMLSVDFSDADIIFTHCTCFDDELMNGLTRKFEGLKPGARIITVSKGIESPEIHFTHSEMAEMGWGAATLYYYVRA